MSRTLATLPLRSAEDIVAARQNARRVAELLGLERQSQTRLATAVSEVARNAFSHARGGEIHFVVDSAARPMPLFSVIVSDRGPGIAELEAVLNGEKEFAPGQGNGLLSARRLVDQFDVRSAPSGTTVRMSVPLPRGGEAWVGSAALDAIALQLPRPGADPLLALHDQNRELIDSLSALQERQAEANRLNRELEDTNRGVVALYSELDQKAEQLRSASDMKSRFLSHMSHEFRTPLNSILALARLLADRVDGDLNSEQSRQVDYIRKSAQGLLEMVNDLLDLAKVEAGKLDLKPTLFDVQTLFASLRGALRPLKRSPGVELLFDEADGLPELFADEPKLSQILRNFISNALKFTELGHVRVSAQLDAAAQRMRFTVEDTGIGIAPDAVELVFEEFSQIDGQLQQGGTGLGLPLSRRLAQLMGGAVSVRSTVGSGSTFELWLPLHFGQPAAHAGLAAQPTDRPATLLIVDDQEAFRYVIRRIAQDAGCDVLEAADGEVGLRIAQAHRPDIVVLDLHMPNMDGFNMLGQLASSDDAALRAMPVIVCTSQALTPQHKRQLQAAYAIVSKDEVSRGSITALLQGLLMQRGERRDAARSAAAATGASGASSANRTPTAPDPSDT